MKHDDYATQIRQGDIFLVRIPEPRDHLVALGEDDLPLGGLRVEGERTGHVHELRGEIYDIPNGRRAILLHDETPLTHQEHEHVLVPAGWWEIRVQREWVPASAQTTRRWD